MNQLRNPTGTKDLNPADVAIREYIVGIAKECFTNCGGVQIDTPVMELYSNVKNLYGEEFHKLVYRFKDEHDDLILRYDLTVPFARFVGTNGLKLFRRYQVGTVYRCDDPQISKGRYRAFMQADFDIAGADQNSGIFDIEILQLADNLLSKLLGTSTFTIRLNHKDIIVQYLTKLLVPSDKMQTVCSSIDKLDKRELDDVCRELTQKGLDGEIIMGIKKFISELLLNGGSPREILDYLKGFIDDATYILFSSVLDRLHLIGLSNIVFDPLLVRGLDYYTGIIFEGYYTDKLIMPTSICAGGRYDNLIGKFSNHGKIPAVGLSLGVERIVTILENTGLFKFPLKSADVYVASVGKNILNDRIKLCGELRKLNISTMMSHLENPKMKSQFSDVFTLGIKFMVVIGPDEVKSGKIRIKVIDSRSEEVYDRDVGINKLKQLIGSS
jgi:histidyl-tRNA synthetase